MAPQISVKDSITSRLICAAIAPAREAIRIEAAHAYPGRDFRSVEEELPHLQVMELAATAVVMSIAATESQLNELFTGASDELSKSMRRRPRENVTPGAELRWARMWEHGIPGRGYSALEKCQIALELADIPPLPSDRGSVQQFRALLALRNALVHAEPKYEPHAPILQKDRGKLEQLLADKFVLSTMTSPHAPFVWRRCLSAGCAKWAVETQTALMNDFYAAIGSSAKSSVRW